MASDNSKSPVAEEPKQTDQASALQEERNTLAQGIPATGGYGPFGGQGPDMAMIRKLQAAKPPYTVTLPVSQVRTGKKVNLKKWVVTELARYVESLPADGRVVIELREAF